MKKHIKILLGVLSIIVVFYMSAKKSTKEGLILKVNKAYPQNQNVSSFCPPGQKLIKHACGSGAEQAMRSGQKPQWGPYNYDAMLKSNGHCSTSCNCHNVWMQCGVGGGGAVGGINYSPMKRNEVKNRTYIGPSPDDKRKCEQRGRGHLPCGDPQGDRCIRSVASCKSLGGCGSHPSHCGTCMERNYNPIQNCLLQSGIHCSKCGSGTELSSDRTKCLSPIQWCQVQNGSICSQCAYGYKLQNNTCVRNILAPQGLPGLSGDRGGRGAAGGRGPKGFPGVKGRDAQEGDVGWRGPMGVPGAFGPGGPRGNRGMTGEVGHKGPIGEKGQTTIVNPWTDKGIITSLRNIYQKITEKNKQLSKKKNPPINLNIRMGDLGSGSISSYHHSSETMGEGIKMNIKDPEMNPARDEKENLTLLEGFHFSSTFRKS